MKTRRVLGVLLLCLASGLAIATVATPLEATPPAAIGAAAGTSVSGCFPIDECNICCPLSGGKLVCTDRACV